MAMLLMLLKMANLFLSFNQQSYIANVAHSSKEYWSEGTEYKCSRSCVAVLDTS